MNLGLSMALLLVVAGGSAESSSLRGPGGFLAEEGFQMVGEGVLEYSMFKIDVYRIGYFRGTKSGKEMLLLTYLRPVSADLSNRGWEKGLKMNFGEVYGARQEQVKWLMGRSPDMVKGDRFAIVRDREEVVLYHNDREVARRKDPILAAMVFSPWIGEQPVDRKLKAALLGK